MKELLQVLIPYFGGMICTFIMFRPDREWEDGYYTAKNTYDNWNKGFNTAWEKASKIFSDYETGFGDGFETGWLASEEQREDNR